MRILLASSELHPYSKSGGLADMIGALAKFFGREGHRVGVVTPLYRGIRDRFPGIAKFDYYIDLPLGGQRVQADVYTLEPSPGVTIYFINEPHFYDRPGLYMEGGADYPDNPQRFIFLSKCVAHLARYLTWQPELVHSHDWQTGLVPILMLHQKLTEGWRTPPRTCLTIHNLAYQGHYPRVYFDYTNLPLDYYNPRGVEFHGGMNCLKAGIVYSDLITTVSPRYAREITTPEFGCGLDGELRQRGSSVLGILNGVDYEEWNTRHNPHLEHAYDRRSLAGKQAQKLDLRRELGLPADPGIPVFGNITRLVHQKGVDFQLAALEEMLPAGMQFVLLGSGSRHYEQAYLHLASRFPKQVAVRIGFDPGLSHRIEAGADFYLMPSRFEPCGLNQMYSLRYGTIPIVRATGGLDDTVVDASDSPAKANGIKFRESSARALAKAIRKALVLYSEPQALRHYQRNAMEADFSWEVTTARYLAVFNGKA